MIKKKRWKALSYDCRTQLKIARELNISPELAQICINRGLTSVDQVEDFLSKSQESFHSPFLFRDMEKAVELIKSVLARNGKILIFGDYDVDGITGTVLLYQYLSNCGARVDYYIPDRIEEGYGLNKEAMKWAYEENYSLIITVDCGINAVNEINLANSLGMQVIITDHHQAPEILPPAAAILNPKVTGENYPFLDLSGVGVAWKLAQALHIKTSSYQGKVILDQYLDLVCLGTVADVVSLTGENRVIVALGLKNIGRGKRPGIRALLNVTRLDQKKITAGQVGFILAPRLNAAGRISQAALSAELLISSDEQECFKRAELLNQENIRRQQIEGNIFQEALEMVEKSVPYQKNKVLVLAADNWHPGVIGIVASRLVERFCRPVVLFSIAGDIAKGSARSIESFHICQAFEHCRDLLIQFGGHKMAAGLKIKTERIDDFRKKINQYAEERLTANDLIPEIKVDLEIDISKEVEELVQEIEQLEPFGQGNPQPVFASRELKVVDVKTVGSNFAHLKIKLESGTYQIDAIGFNMASQGSWIIKGMKVAVAFVLKKNYWNGQETIQMVLKDLQPISVVFRLNNALAVSGAGGENEDPFSQLAVTGEEEDLKSCQKNKNWQAVDCSPVKARSLWYREAIEHYFSRHGQTLVLVSELSRIQHEQILAEMYLGKLGMTVLHGDTRQGPIEKQYIEETFEMGTVPVLITTPEFVLSWSKNREFLAGCRLVILLPLGESTTETESLFFRQCRILLEESKDKVLLLGGPALFKRKEISGSVNHVGWHVPRFFDQRGLKERFSYLLKLIAGGERCLVYCAFKYQVEELVQKIGDSGIIPKEKVGRYSGCQLPRCYEMLMELVKTEELQVVVAAPPFGCPEPGIFDHIVFFHAPLTRNDFYYFTGWPGEKGVPNIHFLFNDIDVKICAQVFQENFPNRESLVKLYQEIKSLFQSSKRIKGNLKEIWPKLTGTGSGSRRCKDSIIDAGFSILVELGLISVTNGEEESGWEMAPEGIRCNLEDSLRYREGLRELKAAHRWHTLVAEPDLVNYLHSFSR